MIPAAFGYQRPTTVDAALQAISGADGGVKVLAGGQSLLPLLKLRLAGADTLVDIGRLSELRGMREQPDGGYEVGALTTYADVIAGTALSWVADAVQGIGDVQVRNRGTVGGSIAHADPASDLPAIGLALDYSAVLRSTRGERVVPWTGSSKARSRPGWPRTSCSWPFVVGRSRPVRQARTASWLNRRPGTRSSGWPWSSPARAARSATLGVALTGVGEAPYRAKAVEAALVGSDGVVGGRGGRGRPRDGWPDRRQRHPRRSRVPDADGGGLYTPRHRGRARR